MGKRFLPAFCVVFFFFTVSALFVYSWLHHYFGSISFQSAMTYLSLPRTGVETVYIVDFLTSMLGIVPLTLVFGLAMHFLAKKGGIAGVSFDIAAFTICSILLFLTVRLVFRIERNHEVLDYVDYGSETTTYFDETFREVTSSQIAFPEKKRNLLLLVLESMEEPVTDPILFGENLIPKLDALHDDNVHFNRWVPTEGSLFSMAAFTSFLYGAPLIALKEVPLDGDMMASKIPVFQPRVPSILGILEEHGYDVTFARGADSLHNSMNILIEKGTKHGLQADRDYFLQHDPDAATLLTAWGLPDSYLYRKVREMLTQKMAGGRGQPFAFMILTLNTHNPGVTEPGMPAPFGDYRDSFRQADTMAAQFIEWAQSQPWADNTTFIVMGDHPNTQSEVGAVSLPADRSRRRIFNFFLNLPPELPRDDGNQTVTNWDLAPTILEALGATVPDGKFGLGTSFFSTEKTLLEIAGLEYHNKMIRRNSERYRKLFIDGNGETPYEPPTSTVPPSSPAPKS